MDENVTELFPSQCELSRLKVYAEDGLVHVSVSGEVLGAEISISLTPRQALVAATYFALSTAEALGRDP